MALLAVKRTSDADYPKHIQALICGPNGAGKTLMSTTFPNPWFISAEGGLMSIVERDIPYTVLPDPGGQSTYDALQEVLKRLSQTPAVRAKQFGFPVDTLVIDTIDQVSHLLLAERMKAERHDTATLQDYGWLKERLTWFAQALRAMDIHVVYTCHLKAREIDGKTQLIPAIEGGFSEKIADWVDIAAVLKSNIETEIQGKESVRVIKRHMHTFPEGIDWLKDRSGKLPYEFEINFEDDYQRLAETIYGADKVPEVTDPDAPVPEEEVAAAEVEAEEAPVVDGPYECDECRTKYDEEDQDSISKIKFGRSLCKSCFTEAVK